MINLDRRPVDAISELGVFSPNSSKGIHQWRTEVKGQRTLRESLYRHVVHLDAKLRDAPDALVFPDAYSLLFWIWTFQLFDQLYTGAPGEVWKSIFIAARQRITVQPGFSPKSDGLKLQKVFEMRPFHHGREHFFENIISRKKLRRFHPPLQEQGAIEIRSQDSLD